MFKLSESDSRLEMVSRARYPVTIPKLTLAATAHTNLAEVLLTLNAGLVMIINQFLHRHEVPIDYASVTSLSERSRRDTCRTLRLLCHRLLQSPSPQELRGDSLRTHSGESEAHKKNAASYKHTRVRRPMLAKEVIADSAKPAQIAMVKPRERKKKKQSKPHSSTGSDSSAAQSRTSLALSSTQKEVDVQTLSRPKHHRIQTLHEAPVPRGQRYAMATDQSHLPYRQHIVRASPSTPRLTAVDSEQRIITNPSQSDLLSPIFATDDRKPTPTRFSTDSNSTKLGEIPLHKWPVPHDFEAMSLLNKEALQKGWPVTDLDLERQKRKKGLRFLRLFRSKKNA